MQRFTEMIATRGYYIKKLRVSAHSRKRLRLRLRLRLLAQATLSIAPLHKRYVLSIGTSPV
jgi:hypothetical protein